MKRLVWKKLKQLDSDSDSDVDSTPDAIEIETQQPSKSIIEEMIIKVNTVGTVAKYKTKEYSLKNELKLFESTGERSSQLNYFNELLNTIQPTSIESERAFSIAKYFCSYLRSSMGDETLHSLVFLKYFFLRNKYGLK